LVHAVLTMLWLVAGFVLALGVAGSLAVALLSGSLAAATMLALIAFVIPPTSGATSGQ
jgi:hypothetical protein